MKQNVGSMDRNIRIAAGIVLLLTGLFAQIDGELRIGAILVAGIAFATAFLNFWPLWAVLGISTHKEEREEAPVEMKEKTEVETEKKEEEQEKPAGH